MVTDRPGDLHLVRHREVRWILVPAISIAVFGIAGWVWTLLADGATSGWSTAGAGIALLCAIGVGLWIGLSVWLWVNERRHARSVVADAAVAWPQYSTPAQWAKDVEAVVEGQRADPLQVVGPAAVLSGAVALIAVVAAATGDAGRSLAYGGLVLAAIWVVAAATIAVRAAVSWRARARTRVRLSSLEPFPRCWVSEEGAYFEDTGLVRFHRLSDVRVVEPGALPAHRKELRATGLVTGAATDLTPLDTRLSQSGWAHLAVTSDSSMAHTFWLKLERAITSQRHRYDWVDTVHIRVPPDDVFEAHELAARIRRRWLGGLSS